MTAIYSILHMFVDGICALAMFGVFIPQENGYFYILLYNFCAFALQMPFGVVLDALNQRRSNAKGKCRKADIALWTAITGVLCTVAGALSHPVLLGIGNALFHVGGGIGTIQEDFHKGWKGKGLGVFVAPGAFGLYLGTLAGKGGVWLECFLIVSVLSVLLCLGTLYMQSRSGRVKGKPEAVIDEIGQSKGGARGKTAVAACCFAVVILRSCLGMSATFPWKAGILAGTLSVLALVAGKMAGGFLAARHGSERVAAVSLALAAFCYLFSSAMPIGLTALFLFNMTMPITLYWMVCEMPGQLGFAFGFLTFALFLGFLPGYFSAVPALGGSLIGCAGSLLSLALILMMKWMQARSLRHSAGGLPGQAQ